VFDADPLLLFPTR